jgi:hypothetical protein
MYKGKTYSGFLTKETMGDNDIAVFGSNTQGRHGAGTAKICRDLFGAKYGQASRLQGQSWGMITTDLTTWARPSVSKDVVKSEIEKLYKFAEENPDKNFKVMYTGLNTMNLSGFTNQEFADMFNAFPIPENVVFEKEFSTLM